MREIGLIRLRIGIIWVPLWIRHWTSGFHKPLSLVNYSFLQLFWTRHQLSQIGPKRDENGGWRRFLNEELHSLFRSLNIVRVIKCRRLRWAGNVARMEEVLNRTLLLFNLLIHLFFEKLKYGLLIFILVKNL